MGYDITMEETYTRGPGYGVKMNTRVSESRDTLEEVIGYLKESSEKIRKEYILLKEWTEDDGPMVIHKILFTRHRGMGRLLRKYVIHKHRIAKYDDSLI